jgi:hypothetical protein
VDGACDGTNGYIPFFSPWFESDEYRTAVPEGFERTIEEQELVERFGVDDGQLAWRRQKIAQNGRELFMQEYPATPEEAFIASGRPVFDPELVVPLLRDAPLPLSRMAVEGGKLAPHSRGELLVYKEHDTAQTYTIGADVAMGVRGGDYSVAQVLDGDKQQVATWRGHIHPDEFASVLKALGDYYNNALVAVETEKHGLLAAVILWRTLNYANIYFTVREGQIDEKDTTNIGFKTTVETKPMVIDRLRAAVRDGDIKLYDTETLREMQTFIVTESGKMEAEDGCHDDCVMSLEEVRQDGSRNHGRGGPCCGSRYDVHGHSTVQRTLPHSEVLRRRTAEATARGLLQLRVIGRLRWRREHEVPVARSVRWRARYRPLQAPQRAGRCFGASGDRLRLRPNLLRRIPTTASTASATLLTTA